MPDTKISAAADIVSVVSTDMLPVARSGSTTAYHATMAEIATWANTNLPVASTTTLGGVKVDGTSITISSGVISGAAALSPSSSSPLMDGTAAPGVATAYSRGDHIHPSDTSRAPLASPALTGSPTGPTVTPATDNSTKLATTAFVQSAMTAAGAGVSSWNTRTGAVTLALADVTGVGGAPLASPTFTGTVTIPAGAVISGYAPLASPAFTGTPSLPTGTVGVTQAAGNSSTALATTAFVAPTVQAAQDSTGRNLVMNGTFVIQQRGAGPWTYLNGFTADRWNIGATTDAVSYTIAALTDADRAAIGDEAARYALQNVFTGNAATGAYNFISQAIEGVRRLSGKTAILSFWAKANSGTPRLGINSLINYGSGGSPSAAMWALTTGNAVTISTTWTRYTSTITWPTASGKTLGTNGDDSAGVTFWYSSGATNAALSGNIGVQSGTVQLWGVQLEIGTQATPLDAGGSPQQILSQCQRFFCIVSASLRGPASAAGQTFDCTVSLPVTMRATATVSLLAAGVSGNVTAGNITLVTTAQPGNYRFELLSTAAGDTYALNYQYTLSADL